MGLSRLSISGRIYGAFGALIILMALLVIIAIAGVQLLSSTFGQYRQAASQAAGVADLTKALADTRLAFSSYQLLPSTENAQHVEALIAALGQANGGHADAAALDQHLDAYSGQVAAMMALDSEVAQLTRQMDAAGIAATDTLGAMIALASQSANLNAKAAAVSGLAMQNLLQMRLAANGMRAASEDSFAATSGAAQASQDALTQLRSIFFKTEDIAQVDATLGQLSSYVQAIAELYERLKARAALGQEAQKIDAELASLYSGLQSQAETRQAGLGKAAEAQAGQISIGALAAGGLALVIALVFAIVIARWLSGSIRAISEAMQQMAAGDFDVTLNHGETQSELGRMAQALDIFGANGRAVRDNVAQREIEAARAAHAGALREKLQAEMEAVVAAAAEGDFTSRLTRDYEADELNRVAASINGLVETVARGLAETGDVLSALANADLSPRVMGDYRGAFGQLKADTNALAEALTGTMVRLGHSSGALKRATGEILSGANDLSARTARQASALEETAGAIARLSQDILDNAGQAEAAAASTIASSTLARDSGVVMARATDAMGRITASSTKISNIIGLIDDIAFQTNLLALNASVEAARAGDAGKGFAVVAVEVRRLAQSAAGASSEVKQLIDQSASEVGGGSRLVGEAASKLAAILAAVEEDSGRMQAIASSSRTQAAAVESVAQSMAQMDEMTQNNAALVEETNAAIEQTEAQASELDGIVAQFSLPQQRTLRRVA